MNDKRVEGTVHWIVWRAVWESVLWAVGWNVRGAATNTVCSAVDDAGAGHDAVYRAVYWTVRNDPEHPNLDRYLQEAGIEHRFGQSASEWLSRSQTMHRVGYISP